MERIRRPAGKLRAMRANRIIVHVFNREQFWPEMREFLTRESGHRAGVDNSELAFSRLWCRDRRRRCCCLRRGWSRGRPQSSGHAQRPKRHGWPTIARGGGETQKDACRKRIAWSQLCESRPPPPHNATPTLSLHCATCACARACACACACAGCTSYLPPG